MLKSPRRNMSRAFSVKSQVIKEWNNIDYSLLMKTVKTHLECNNYLNSQESRLYTNTLTISSYLEEMFRVYSFMMCIKRTFLILI